MRTEKKQINIYGIRSAAIGLAALIVLASCNKNNDKVTNDNNRIAFIVADNSTLSILNQALIHTGGNQLLKQDGPYTLLAPTNSAANIGVLYTTATNLSNVAYYHIIDGILDVNKLPFQFNQEFKSLKGKLYITRYAKGLDTVVSINGSRVLTKNISASNGLLQILYSALTPDTYAKLGDALASDQNTTLFYQAIVTSGMLQTINGAGPYTIFAPDNAAMLTAGYTLDQISKTDPQTLKKLISAHIANDRHFINDYYLIGDLTTSTAKQTMLDGSIINISFLINYSAPDSFGGIELQGASNSNVLDMDEKDIVTDNGVLHTIQGILKP